MARIRTVKPSFFRHEGLQELELEHPGQYPMFVFAGLWGHCDKLGRFPWKPRTLKLDILPFLPFDMASTLTILKQHGYLQYYEVDGKGYGLIPTFVEHQRINGKEAQAEGEYPGPPDVPPPAPASPVSPLPVDAAMSAQGSNGEASDIADETFLGEPGKQRGSNGEAIETTGREGKGTGREQEGNGDVGQVEDDEARPVRKSAATWEAYAGAYRTRYRVDPVRNRSVSAMLCKVVDKLGGEEAPLVAAFYVTHRSSWYAEKMHPVNLLLQDAEKLRTEWATGRQALSRFDQPKAHPKSLVELL